MGIFNFMHSSLEWGFTKSLSYWKLIKVILKSESKLKWLVLHGVTSLQSQRVHICCWALAVAARARSSKASAQHLGTVCDRRHSGSYKQHCHVVLELRFGPVHTRRRKQFSFWIHSQVLMPVVFFKSVSSPNPLEVSMALSTGYVSSMVTEGNKHANSCALICEKYLASKCLS